MNEPQFFFLEYEVLFGDTFTAVTASVLSTMIRCVKNTDTVTYKSDRSGKLWQCPVGSSGRYVYLHAGNPGIGLVEVEVYARNMPSSFMETCGHDEG